LVLLFGIFTLSAAITSWTSATLQGVYGFAPHQKVAVTLKQQGSPFILQNNLTISVDVDCGNPPNRKIFSNVPPMSITEVDNTCFLGGLTFVTVYQANTQNQIVSLGMDTVGLILLIVTPKSSNYTYSLIVSAPTYICSFNEIPSIPSSADGSQTLLLCEAPVTPGITFGNLVTMNSVVQIYQTQQNLQFNVSGPQTPVTFNMSSYWYYAKVSSGNNIEEGTEIAVTGVFNPGATYSCYFESQNGNYQFSTEFTSPVSSQEFDCSVPGALAPASFGQWYWLKSVTEIQNNHSRILQFGQDNINNWPSFYYTQSSYSTGQVSPPQPVTYVSWWAILGIILGASCCCGICIVIIIFVRRRRHHFHYQEIPQAHSHYVQTYNMAGSPGIVS